MARCGCASSTCNCVVEAGANVAVTGSGSALDPYVIAASGGGGGGSTLVQVTDSPTIDLSLTGDGSLATPYNIAAAIKAGCGITTDGSGVAVNTAAAFAALTRRNCDDDSDEPGTVPLPGPDTQGMVVYCDTAGDLRTKPEKFTDVETTGANEAHVPAATVLPFSSSIITLTITNPSSQYCMCGYVVFAQIGAMNSAPGTVIRVLQEKDLDNGSGFTLTTGYSVDQRGKSVAAGSGQFRQVFPVPICLDPGETKNIRHRVTYQRDPVDNGGAVSITASAHEIYWVGTNI